MDAICAFSRFISYCHQENLLPNADPIANTVFNAICVADADVERDGDVKCLADPDSVAVPLPNGDADIYGVPHRNRDRQYVRFKSYVRCSHPSAYNQSRHVVRRLLFYA